MAKVKVENGKSVTMSELQIRDKVKTGSRLKSFNGMILFKRTNICTAYILLGFSSITFKVGAVY